MRPWLLLLLAAELCAAALASATRNGCAGATLLVAAHLVFNAATGARLNEYGSVRRVGEHERRRLVGASAAMTALGVVASVTAAQGPPAVALGFSAAFAAAAGCWLLFLAGRLALLWLMARAYAGQRC